MKVLVLGSCCSNHFPRVGCSCLSCSDSIFKKRKHSSILIKDIMIDCGQDWKIIPSVVKKIIITHAHPDHAFGIGFHLDKELHMTEITKKQLQRFLKDKDINVLDYKKTIEISRIKVTAYPVAHSSIAPAVCLKLNNLLYCPDVKDIFQKSQVFKGVVTYIGDGSTLMRPTMYRKSIGHESMLGQMKWCKKYGVKKVYFTHIGHVRLSHKDLNNRLQEMNKKFGFTVIKALKEGDTILL